MAARNQLVQDSLERFCFRFHILRLVKEDIKTAASKRKKETDTKEKDTPAKPPKKQSKASAKTKAKPR